MALKYQTIIIPHVLQRNSAEPWGQRSLLTPCWFLWVKGLFPVGASEALPAVPRNHVVPPADVSVWLCFG